MPVTSRWLGWRSTLGLVLLLAGPGRGAGQDLDDGGIPEHRAQEARAKAAAWARLARSGPARIQDQTSLPIDVTYYHLQLDLDPATRVLRGDVRVAARMGPAASSHVLLDLTLPMQVDSLRVDGAPAAFQHTGDVLDVDLGRTLAPRAPFEIRVFYAGTPDASSALHFDTRNSQPLVWTLSEPFGSRTWWPCQDTPADKADSVAIDLTVPSTLTAVSNGKLTGTIVNGSKKTFRWREGYPITPYLVSIAAHPYTPLTTTYTPMGGGSLPVTLWAFPDQVGLAQPLVATTVQVLQRFATLFGEYPFLGEKYDLAQFPWSGGMEHQTATSLCCWSTFLTVHETAHQWFGDLVTCESFSDVWLNEGFATYAEALWDEGVGGAAAYAANIWANRYYGNGTIWVPPADSGDFARVFDGNLSYNKASWVLHMLRGVVGDAVFFDVLRTYAAAPSLRYGTATTDDFRAVAEAVSGRDLSWFFSQWIYQPYFPTYAYSWNAAAAGGNWGLDLDIEQMQMHTTYDMPLQIQVTTGAGSQRFVVRDSLPQQSFHLQVGAEPQAVTIDPDRWVLCTAEAALPAPSFWRGVLLVNAASWAVGTTLSSVYADSVCTAGYPFSFWDVQPAPGGGYVPQLPAPLGHGNLPVEVLQEFSTVIWVGDAEIDAWNAAPLAAYLQAGGNLLLLTRRGQEFLYPARSRLLGLRWAENARSTLASATAMYPSCVPMPTLGVQSEAALFETGFDLPETVLLLAETASFGVPRGIAAWRQPPDGGALRARGGQLAFVSGRPYRWEHTSLRHNVGVILAQLFGEKRNPSTSPAPPAFVTRLLEPVPNPFNPSVRLRYELATAGRARLVIHDTRGRAVCTLLDAVRPAGSGEVLWDGRDRAGREVASGIYVARLEANGKTHTSKVTLLR